MQAEVAVKLSYKVGDENGRENQTKPRWVWSVRHSENGMGSVNDEKKSCDEVKSSPGCYSVEWTC